VIIQKTASKIARDAGSDAESLITLAGYGKNLYVVIGDESDNR
jgi:hypothetical protein